MRREVCASVDLTPGVVRTTAIAPGLHGMPRTALVLRQPDGSLRAYVNLCMHLPVPLDVGRGRFLNRAGDQLECRTHGARYRLDDGYCVDGPCKGMRLEPLEALEDAGVVYVLDPAATR